MRFSQDFLQNLRDRFVLSELAAPHIRLKRQGQEHSGLCPFHKEKSPSFTLNDQKGVFHCFGCGAGGDIIGFFMRIHNFEFFEAVKELAHKAGMSLPEAVPLTTEEVQQQTDQEQLYPLMQEVCAWYQEQLKQANARSASTYLQSRRLQQSTVDTFQLGFAPARQSVKREFLRRGYSEDLLLKAGLLARKGENGPTYDRFRNRVIFPILDKRGRVIGFGGRVLDDAKPKYLNSPETLLFSKRQSLYGLHQTHQHSKNNQPLIIVEGYTDVLALYQAGYKKVVAPLGTALTPEQIQQLWRLNSEPILCFDGDEAGQRAAYRAAERALPLLKPGFSMQFVQLPHGEDPDSLVQKHALDTLESLFTSPQVLQEVLWQQGVTDQRTQTPEQRALVRKNVLSQLETIQDPSVRSLYQQEFKERFYQAFRSKPQVRGRAVNDAIPQEQRGGIRTRFDPMKRQRFAVLAAMINYPQVFVSMDEQIAQVEFKERELEELKQEILDIFHSIPNLDDQVMRSHILSRGYRRIVEIILSKETYVHASFAKLGMTEATVLDGWQEVVHLMQDQRNMKEDVEKVKSEFTTHFRSDTWQRFQNMKRQTMSG
ncbi:MAG: DNA primase [Pseudomonadota bacterium]